MTPTHFVFCCCFAISLTGLVFNRTHFLSALLCLEGMVLTLYLILAAWAFENEVFTFACAPLVMLTFAACEASAGLALLVASSRTHGTDRLQALNLLQC